MPVIGRLVTEQRIPKTCKSTSCINTTSIIYIHVKSAILLLDIILVDHYVVAFGDVSTSNLPSHKFVVFLVNINIIFIIILLSSVH